MNVKCALNDREWVKTEVFVTLPALQKHFVNIFFVFAWEFCIEKGRGFLVNFFWSPLPGKRSTKIPLKIRGKFGAKFGRKFGIKNRKFGELSFCHFSDLSVREKSVQANGSIKTNKMKGAFSLNNLLPGTVRPPEQGRVTRLRTPVFPQVRIWTFRVQLLRANRFARKT